MSDERLARIESAVLRLAVGQTELRAEMRAGVVEQRQYTDSALRDLRTHMGVLVEDLRTDMRAGQDELRTHMGVLVEDLIDRIRATGATPDQLRREIRAGDTAVRAECDRRLTPLELAVKDHSVELKRRKGRRA
jgi:hypothetical protein